MLKRKIYDELLKWKNSAEHKSLLVKGARQVGKTFIIDLFGKQEFKLHLSEFSEKRVIERDFQRKSRTR